MTGVAAIIPAKDEGDRIGATVAAALVLPGVDLVVVVDDGSSDQTGRVAKAAGARVVRHSRNRGKAAAMESGAEAVRLLDGAASRHLLFLDADLGETARMAAPLIEPVVAGEADMTIAVFVTRVKLGGHGFVVKLAREGVQRITGWTPDQPLNGQRCLTRAAFEAARPWHGASAWRPVSPLICSARAFACARSRWRWPTGRPAPTGRPSFTGPDSSAMSHGPWRPAYRSGQGRSLGPHAKYQVTALRPTCRRMSGLYADTGHGHPPGPRTDRVMVARPVRVRTRS